VLPVVADSAGATRDGVGLRQDVVRHAFTPFLSSKDEHCGRDETTPVPSATRGATI
jgi:hypothetical protein